jgi:DHA2 family multidrug resistance protein
VDLVGFLLATLFFGGLELTLDRGQRLDWFASPFITTTAIAAALALLAFIPWELTRKEPIVPISMFARSNFAIASLFLMLTGVILFGTTLFIPQLLQTVMGYTATEAGLALTAGGVATVFVMPFVAILASRVDARLLIGVAFVVQALALLYMSHLDTDLAFANAAVSRMIQSLGLPFLFVPISMIAYVGLAPNESNRASAMMNVARNLGGTIGIASVQILLAQRQQFHQARLVEAVNPLNPNYAAALNGLTHTLARQGQLQAARPGEALAVIYRTVERQAAMLSFIDVFHTLMIVVLCALPLLLLVRGQSAQAARGASA